MYIAMRNIFCSSSYGNILLISGSRIQSMSVKKILHIGLWLFLSVSCCSVWTFEMDNIPQQVRDLYNTRENITLSPEKQVLQYLQWKYSISGRGGRPVLNISTPTNVTFGLGLIQMELDEKRKVFITSMWSRLKWRDEYLTWNPDDYGGITMVRVAADDIWIPDIMLYNTADPDGAVRNALILVMYDGMVQWIPHQLFQSSCKIDVTNFPFDGQTCTMWFGSWTHSQREIDLDLAFPGGIDLGTFQSDYKESCEWDIVEPRVEKKLLPPNDTNPVAVIAFTLQLQRKVVFSSYILTLPCVFLAFLTLVVFCMPPDRPDRTGLAMNLFGSFLVLLLILVEAAPPTASSVPLIGVYYCFNMVIIMLAIFLSALVVNLQRGSDYRLPYWVRLLFLQIFAKIVFITVPNQPKLCRISSNSKSDLKTKNTEPDREVAQRLVHHRRKTSLDEEKGGVNNHLYNQTRQKHLTTVNHNGHTTLGNNVYVRLKPTETESRTSGLESNILDICNMLHDIRLEIQDKEEKAAHVTGIINEWKQLARVLDRMFMLFFLVAIILSLVLLFPRPPWWYGTEGYF